MRGFVTSQLSLALFLHLQILHRVADFINEDARAIGLIVRIRRQSKRDRIIRPIITQSHQLIGADIRQSRTATTSEGLRSELLAVAYDLSALLIPGDIEGRSRQLTDYRCVIRIGEVPFLTHSTGPGHFKRAVHRVVGVPWNRARPGASEVEALELDFLVRLRRRDDAVRWAVRAAEVFVLFQIEPSQSAFRNTPARL